mmetsp:Transcript_17596/g.26189  ORF Transcript_17596/g.26189 Transcript_17596/m.26189 type:complete len:208 (-) Transcript_17596:298-921(-)
MCRMSIWSCNNAHVSTKHSLMWCLVVISFPRWSPRFQLSKSPKNKKLSLPRQNLLVKRQPLQVVPPHLLKSRPSHLHHQLKQVRPTRCFRTFSLQHQLPLIQQPQHLVPIRWLIFLVLHQPLHLVVFLLFLLVAFQTLLLHLCNQPLPPLVVLPLCNQPLLPLAFFNPKIASTLVCPVQTNLLLLLIKMACVLPLSLSSVKNNLILR